MKRLYFYFFIDFISIISLIGIKVLSIVIMKSLFLPIIRLVNFLSFSSSKQDIVEDVLLNYYLGVLNSKLINFIFASKSGNTQVSTNELNLLPFPKKNIGEISQFVSDNLLELRKYQQELDKLVCEAYDLSADETDLISKY